RGGPTLLANRDERHRVLSVAGDPGCAAERQPTSVVGPRLVDHRTARAAQVNRHALVGGPTTTGESDRRSGWSRPRGQIEPRLRSERLERRRHLGSAQGANQSDRQRAARRVVGSANWAHAPEVSVAIRGRGERGGGALAEKDLNGLAGGDAAHVQLDPGARRTSPGAELNGWGECGDDDVFGELLTARPATRNEGVGAGPQQWEARFRPGRVTDVIRPQRDELRWLRKRRRILRLTVWPTRRGLERHLDRLARLEPSDDQAEVLQRLDPIRAQVDPWRLR